MLLDTLCTQTCLSKKTRDGAFSMDINLEIMNIKSKHLFTFMLHLYFRIRFKRIFALKKAL